MASTSSFSIHDFNSLEKEVAEVLLQLRILTPFSSPFLIRTWFSKGRRSAINVEPSPSPPSSPLLLPPPPPSTKVDQEQPETTTSSCLSPNSPLSFPLLSDNIDYQSKNPLKIPMKKKIKIVKDQETSILLSVPPPPPSTTTKITLNPKPSLSFFLPGDNNINNIVRKNPQTSSFSSNNVRKKGLMMISSGQQVRFKQVSNNNPVVTTEFTLGPTTPSPQQKSHLQPLINNINHQMTTAATAGLGQVSVSNTKSYPKCLKAITSIMNTMTSEKTIRMSYNPTISTTTTATAAVSEQTRKRKFEVQ
ncbi:hypothetical protein AQUCO_01000183v1 [Aquilegia coerulea]|uniref:Uncharacterized protein n=1 Tax=Aquilegia coerulea TaxID=218851 RepID=A0A2G5E8M0_AQUCA|nr:hypothetical protein AQUCO_01000183v1 [Aquilegia coerulea]